MILKGLMRASPDYYKFEWIDHGEDLIRADMEEVYTSEGEGTQVVAWCVSPRVCVRPTTPNKWGTACPAKVFSKAKNG